MILKNDPNLLRKQPIGKDFVWTAFASNERRDIFLDVKGKNLLSSFPVTSPCSPTERHAVKKLSLDLETLTVQSFETAPAEPAGRGTVLGRAAAARSLGLTECNTACRCPPTPLI
jgi:hypothetical protein